LAFEWGKWNLGSLKRFFVCEWWLVWWSFIGWFFLDFYFRFWDLWVWCVCSRLFHFEFCRFLHSWLVEEFLKIFCWFKAGFTDVLIWPETSCFWKFWPGENFFNLLDFKEHHFFFRKMLLKSKNVQI
jgi:hypothetical protein